MKNQLITPNTAKGENIFHCWNATESFYVFTQRGKRGIESAYSQLKKQFGKIYMDITYCANKKEIVQYFN